MITIRNATMEDARFMYELRSNSAISSRCFNQKDFTYESHVLWLQTRLNLRTKPTFIIEKENTRIGVLRLELENDGCNIGIAILPQYQSKGVGRFALDWLVKSGYEDLKAEIMPNNKASMGLFKKAGFKPYMVVMKKPKEQIDYNLE